MAHDDEAPAHDGADDPTPRDVTAAEGPRYVPAGPPRPVQRRSPVVQPTVAEPVVPAPTARPEPPRRPIEEPDPFAIDLSDEHLTPEPLPVAPPERPREPVSSDDFWGADIDEPRPTPFGRLQRRREVEEELEPEQPRRRRFGRRSEREDDFVPGEWSPSDWVPRDVPAGPWGPSDAEHLAPSRGRLDASDPDGDLEPAPFDPLPDHESAAPVPPVPPPVEPSPPPAFDDGFDPDPEPDDELTLDTVDDVAAVEDVPRRRGLFRRGARSDQPEGEPVEASVPSEVEIEPEPATTKAKKPSRKERKAAAAAEAAAAEATASLAPVAAPPVTDEEPAPRRRRDKKDREPKPEKAAREPKPPKAKKAPKERKRAAGEAEDDVLRRLFAGPQDEVVAEPRQPEAPTAPAVETVSAPVLEPEPERFVEPEPIEPAPVEPEPHEPEPVAPPAVITPFDDQDWIETHPIELDDELEVPAEGHVEKSAGPPTTPTDPSTLTQSSGLVATFLVALVAIVAAFGLAVSWPVDVPSPPTAAGATVERVTATIDSVETVECSTSPGPDGGVPATPGECGTVAVTGTDGEKFGFTVDSTQLAGGFAVGDRVVAARTTTENGTSYTFVDHDRRLPLAAVALVVGLLTVAGLRWRGVRTLAAIGVSVVALVAVVLPAIRDGASPLYLALSSAVLLGLFTLYLVNGFTRRTTAAALGLVVGLGLTALLGVLVTRIGLTGGVGTDDGRRMLQLADRIDPAQVTMAAAVFAGLGVLIDLTTRQARAAFEAREHEPTLTARETTARSLTWARENQAGTLLVLTFAFVGAGLTGLLVASAGQPGPLAVLNSEPVATELLRAGACAIGAALAIPITAWIAARLAPHAATEPSVADQDPTT